MEEDARVLVVDDHPVVREGLRAVLSGSPGIQVVGEAASGEQAVKMCEELKPNVVIMDIRMPGMNGIEATQRIKKAFPMTSVVIMTMHDNEAYIAEAVRSGASAFLPKDSTGELVCHAVRAALDGGVLLLRSSHSRQALQGVMPLLADATGEATSDLLSRLTPREIDVLKLLAQGSGNKAICLELSLAEVTVKKHVQSVVGKLGVPDRAHAALLGFRLGLVA